MFKQKGAKFQGCHESLGYEADGVVIFNLYSISIGRYKKILYHLPYRLEVHLMKYHKTQYHQL